MGNCAAPCHCDPNKDQTDIQTVDFEDTNRNQQKRRTSVEASAASYDKISSKVANAKSSTPDTVHQKNEYDSQPYEPNRIEKDNQNGYSGMQYRVIQHNNKLVSISFSKWTAEEISARRQPAG